MTLEPFKKRKHRSLSKQDREAAEAEESLFLRIAIYTTHTDGGTKRIKGNMGGRETTP